MTKSISTSELSAISIISTKKSVMYFKKSEEQGYYDSLINMGRIIVIIEKIHHPKE
ncbi:MAG: hypothetical protein QXX22_12245 [Metallosphaera sp.]